jgi:hypothetical protein
LTKTAKLSGKELRGFRQRAGRRVGLPVDYIPEEAAGNNQTFDVKGGTQTIGFEITGTARPK